MSYKEKIIKQLRKGYSPIEAGPKEEINRIFKNAFKPRVDRNDLDFFFELSESTETKLKAWGFLGLYLILDDKNITDNKKKLKFQKIVDELLNDRSEIEYFGGSTKIKSSLREHHVRRLCALNKSLIFEPVYQYVTSLDGKTDEVIGELFEQVLTRIPDPRVEPLIIEHSKNLPDNNFILKFHMINAFENLGQGIPIQNKEYITEIFKNCLIDTNQDQSDSKEITQRKIKLKRAVIKSAVILDLDLKEETLSFLEALEQPYDDLTYIAKKYKNNQKFTSIVLKKLEESQNPHLIKDLLIAILIAKESIENWKELITENLSKYQIIDGELIEEIQKTNLYTEDTLLSLFNEGEKWQIEFVREFFKNNPEKLKQWSKFREELINILKFFKATNESWDKYPNIKEKKELVLKLLIDLEWTDMAIYCVDNFKNLEDTQLRKMALFIIIKFGKDELMLELKEFLKNNKESAVFFKKFWRNMENREWKFFY